MAGNLGRIDQFIRLLIGMAVLAYIVKDGSPMPDWPLPGLLGAVLMVTAFFSYCPFYDALGFNTSDRTDHRI